MLMFDVKLVCSYLSHFHRCISWSLFETKLIVYLIYNIVDEILIYKIRFEFKNKKKISVTNHIMVHK